MSLLTICSLCFAWLALLALYIYHGGPLAIDTEIVFNKTKK